ncbi:hypothetical protein KC19_1G314400 [Ceratodon purpureus]|uniref:Uncharacterized protein n=1 Tax=Ceratodon purpureus TaxID=3225 RepID=A0A8T0JBR6_CERPU|nr:hypothetical protein KC19_1G314400 [Ceratodon purpureus]
MLLIFQLQVLVQIECLDVCNGYGITTLRRLSAVGHGNECCSVKLFGIHSSCCLFEWRNP